MNGRKFTNEELDSLADMFEKAVSAREAGRRLGRPYSTIMGRYNMLKDGKKRTDIEQLKLTQDIVMLSAEKMIRKLYEMGYRIRGELYRITEAPVNLEDLISKKTVIMETDWKKKYEEALERARKYYGGDEGALVCIEDILQHIFTELRESEREQTMKQDKS